MADSLNIYGPVRLRILDTDCTATLKTWTLPYVDREGGIVLTTVASKAIKHTLLNGAIRYIQGNIRQNVTLNWQLYDATYTAKQCGLTVGTSDLNVPQLTDLYDAINLYNTAGRLAICPGTNGVFYKVFCTSDLTRDTIVPGFYGNISLTFEGRDTYLTAGATGAPNG